MRLVPLGFILISMMIGAQVAWGANLSPRSSLNSSTTQLTQSGTVELVGTIDVSKLSEPQIPLQGGKIKPFLIPDPAAYEQAKNEASDPKYRPPPKTTVNDEGVKGRESAIPAPQTQFVRETKPQSLARPQSISVSLGGLVINGLDNSQCGCTPPDVQVAVGPNHVFEMVNLAGQIFSKTGTSISSFSLATFFGTGTDFISDPQVHYDAPSGRWFASILDISSSSIRLAVSTTSDPTGSFVVRNFSAAPNCPDQPWLGVSDDKVVLSANDFANQCTGGFVGAQYWVINKSQLVSGATPNTFVSTPDSTRVSIHPVRSLSSTSTLFMVSAGCCGVSSVQLFSVTGVPGVSTVSVNSVLIPIATTSIPPHAPQSGTTSLINTNDARIVSAVWLSGALWFGLNDGCVPPGDTATRSCIRLVQLNTATSTKVQDFDYSVSGDYFFYPALSMDSGGNSVVVFGHSNPSIYPELRVTGRAVGDPVNTLQASAQVSAGTGPNTSGRYGDYFGAATDPSSPVNVWVAGQIGAAAPRTWLTRIASVTLGFDFSLSNSGGITVTQGASGSNTITATLSVGVSQSVTLSCTSGLPSGASCSFNPASLTPTTSGATSILTVSTSTLSTPAGTYSITVTGTGSGVSHTTTFTLTVNAAAFGFSLSSSGGITVTQGASGSATITATLTSGVGQIVSLSCSDLPTGASCSFNPSSVTPIIGGATSTLTVNTSNPSTTPGSYTVTVTGTGGGTSSATTFTLTVNAAAFDFSLSSSGGIGTIQGGSGSATITATLTSGVGQIVSLSCSGIPTGASCSFNLVSITPTISGTSSSLTITTASNTPTGTYTVTVTGTAGPLTRSASLTLAVTSRPTQLMLMVIGPGSVARGGSATFDVLVINPGSSALTATLYLDVLGSAGYEYFDTAQISVAAGATGRFQFTWQVPSSLAPGSYQVTVGLIPPRPTAIGLTQITVS